MKKGYVNSNACSMKQPFLGVRTSSRTSSKKCCQIMTHMDIYALLGKWRCSVREAEGDELPNSVTLVAGSTNLGATKPQAASLS